MKQLLKLILLFWLLLGAPASAAIAVVNVPTSGTGSGTSITLSMQCNTGTNFLSVGISSFNSIRDFPNRTTISSVTYAGTALTLATRTVTREAEDTHIYTLVAPTTGSAQNLVVNYSEAQSNGARIIPVCWSGVNQSTPVGSVVSNYIESGISPVSDSISMASGSHAFDVVMCNACSPTAVGSQTAIYNQPSESSSRLLNATAMSWTFSDTRRFAHSVIEIREAGGAPGSIPPRRRVSQ